MAGSTGHTGSTPTTELTSRSDHPAGADHPGSNRVAFSESLNHDEAGLLHDSFAILSVDHRAIFSISDCRFCTKCGSIAVLDRKGLEYAANGTYGLAEIEYKRWMREA